MGFLSKLNDKRKQAKESYEQNKDTWKFIYGELCKKCRRQVFKYLRHKDYERFVGSLCEVCKSNPNFDLGLEENKDE